jgi:8-oxo-dGTP pyrophosphatase MutT (NUDIX family)
MIELLARIELSLRHSPALSAPLDGNPAEAAVALVMRQRVRGEPELLLIRRAERVDDPWSGQIGLPGGRRSVRDTSLAETAIRETREETGIDLTNTPALIGPLDALRPRSVMLPSIVVTPFLMTTHHESELQLNYEVADAFWVPWSALNDPSVSRESDVRVQDAVLRVPSFVIGDHVVWGMTERIIRAVLRRGGTT